jgi:hypothetical protein
MRAEEIARQLVENARGLEAEVELMDEHFERTAFMNDPRNLPWAHFGYLMSIMSQVDLLSSCWDGPDHAHASLPRVIRRAW